jgi:superfamily II DNA/RNA helicase
MESGKKPEETKEESKGSQSDLTT